jgi:hypothetical protein
LIKGKEDGAMCGVRIKRDKELFFGSTLFLVFFLFITHIAGAEDFFVAYAQGDVTVRQGNSWRMVNIGDTLTEENIIRLGKESVAELSSHEM